MKLLLSSVVLIALIGAIYANIPNLQPEAVVKIFGKVDGYELLGEETISMPVDNEDPSGTFNTLIVLQKKPYGRKIRITGFKEIISSNDTISEFQFVANSNFDFAPIILNVKAVAGHQSVIEYYGKFLN